jgi:hypothetical protein
MRVGRIRGSIWCIAVVGLALAGCGSSAPKPRYAGTYPADFVSTFSTHCGQAKDSAVMCSCAVAKIESAVTYTTLQQSVVTIRNGTTDVPWWDQVQQACKRKGPGSPPYIAPDALAYLAPPSSASAASSTYPPAFADSLVSSCKTTAKANGEKNVKVLCACVLSKAEATISYDTAQSELNAGTLGKD